jgi:hypothetical protein
MPCPKGIDPAKRDRDALSPYGYINILYQRIEYLDYKRLKPFIIYANFYGIRDTPSEDDIYIPVRG